MLPELSVDAVHAMLIVLGRRGDPQVRRHGRRRPVRRPGSRRRRSRYSSGQNGECDARTDNHADPHGYSPRAQERCVAGSTAEPPQEIATRASRMARVPLWPRPGPPRAGAQPRSLAAGSRGRAPEPGRRESAVRPVSLRCEKTIGLGPSQAASSGRNAGAVLVAPEVRRNGRPALANGLRKSEDPRQRATAAGGQAGHQIAAVGRGLQEFAEGAVRRSSPRAPRASHTRR